MNSLFSISVPKHHNEDVWVWFAEDSGLCWAGIKGKDNDYIKTAQITKQGELAIEEWTSDYEFDMRSEYPGCVFFEEERWLSL